ncbi:hypothetical protein BO71DRAFT_399890, partial [Aspergillus ellipticus CBS 707.79]
MPAGMAGSVFIMTVGMALKIIFIHFIDPMRLALVEVVKVYAIMRSGAIKT